MGFLAGVSLQEHHVQERDWCHGDLQKHWGSFGQGVMWAAFCLKAPVVGGEAGHQDGGVEGLAGRTERRVAAGLSPQLLQIADLEGQCRCSGEGALWVWIC